MYRIILTLGFVAAASAVFCQGNLLEGDWAGNLEINNVPMDVVLHITAVDGESYTLSLDIPGQDVADFLADEVAISGDSITFGWQVSSTKYVGKRVSPNTIEGKWMIRDEGFDISFRRLVDGIYRREQEPTGDLPYRVQEVAFQSAEDRGVSLSGTLTIPNSSGNVPVVVMITGSGAQDRDEAVYGHRPFLVIADRLTRQGIAVLRFDDRGTARSTGKFEGSTTRDFANDAIGGVEFLRTQSYFKPGNIGLMGHTEGGSAAIIAASEGTADFVVLLATAGLPNADLLIQESIAYFKQTKTPEQFIAQDTTYTRTMFREMRKNPITAPDTVALKAIASAYYAQSELIQSRNKTAEAFYQTQLSLIESPWFHFHATFDPADYLDRVGCPVLALHGANDQKLAAAENLDRIEKLLTANGNDRITAVELEGLNHFFQPGEGILTSEYGTIPVTFDEITLEYIASWINNNAR